MTPSERLWLAATMSDEVHRLAIAGLARRRVDLSPEALAIEFERILIDAAAASPPATDR